MTDTQPDLFSWRYRSTDPETSKAAARKTNRHRTQELILSVLPSIQPATSYEIYDACLKVADVTDSGVRSRLSEMDGTHVERMAGGKSPSGNPAALWRLKEAS